MRWTLAIALCAAGCGGASSRPDGKPAGKLFVELHVQAMVQGDAMARSVRVGDTLQSGDRVELFVVPSEDAYVSVLQVGADDTLAPLYPPGKLEAGKATRLPANGWFELDSNVGEETVVLIASRTPISESDPAAAALVERARTGGTAERRQRCLVAGSATAEAGEATPPTPPESRAGAPGPDQLVMIGGVPVRGLEDVPVVAAAPITADTAREARPATISADGQPARDGELPPPPSDATAMGGRGLLAARGLTYVPAANAPTVIEADPKGVAIAEFSFCHAAR